jgi:hypothetical protein
MVWKVELGAPRNFRKLSKCLASTGNLYRHHDGHALLEVLPGGKTQLIRKGAELAPLIVDRLTLIVTKNGKTVGELPTAAHLNAMLRSEIFLGQFLPVNVVTNNPIYRDDFTLAAPGYNDGGPGQRILYLGGAPAIADSTETIEQFLDVMDFATTADRTNTVAAALTVLFHHLWPGQKPAVLVTATTTHAGKGTITDFFCGSVPKVDVLYEAQDWPMQSQFQRQVQADPEIGAVVFDNVRLDSSGSRGFIRSGFIESMVTSAEVNLASPSAGKVMHAKNQYVVTINANDGRFSPDLLNRGLPIHLAPKGDVHERETPIGNPKLVFLPANRGRIEAELRGMVERWKAAGCPMDEEVTHPMSRWAKTIGGILKVSGFTDFLANYKARQSADDPVREALGILGATKPGKALRPAEWAKIIVDQGLVKTLLPANERDTEAARTRATGVLLSRYPEATFLGRTETKVYKLRLDGGKQRWVRGKNPHVRYVFTVLSRESLPLADSGDEHQTDRDLAPVTGDQRRLDRPQSEPVNPTSSGAEDAA